MKFLRILLSILMLLIFVCILAITCFVFMMDPNKLKPTIAEEIKKKTGYEVNILGKLSWSFFPELAIQMNRLMLISPGQPDPSMDLDHIKIAISFSDLLHSKEMLQGNVRIANMRFKNIQVQHIYAHLDWKNHGIVIQPITAFLYGGSLEGMLEGSKLTTMPQWSWDVQLNQIQIKPLLQDIKGTDNKLMVSGVGQIKLRASTQGKTREEFLSHLNGVTELSLKNGVLEGIDL